MPDSTNDELRGQIADILVVYCHDHVQQRKQAINDISALIHQHTEQAKKQGFYMGCGVGGIHESNVESLWEECIAQLTTNHKGGEDAK